jgi:NhaP-type Na+/H+ or K+/H+ antiporter
MRIKLKINKPDKQDIAIINIMMKMLIIISILIIVLSTHPLIKKLKIMKKNN